MLWTHCKYFSCDDYGRRYFCIHPERLKNRSWLAKLFSKTHMGCSEVGKLESRQNCEYYVDIIMEKIKKAKQANKNYE